jgi:hypothetical protein
MVNRPRTPVRHDRRRRSPSPSIVGADGTNGANGEGATIDQIAMKTLPALAAIPVSLQAVTTTASPSQLSVECKVQVANGTATFGSLIAVPTG